ALQPLMGPSGDAGIATARTNASAGAPGSLPPAQFSYGTETSPTVAAAATAGGGVGDISLNFADTDIREVAAQILGNMLKVNYTIDPAVRGSVTLHTTTPLSRGQLLPTLQAL